MISWKIMCGAVAMAFASLVVLASEQAPSAPRNLQILPAGTAPPTPPPTGSHGHFDALRALPQHYRSWSLREPNNQAQFDQLTRAGVSEHFSYAPAQDTHRLKQDAAKFVNNGPDNISRSQTLDFPIGLTSGTLVLVVDFFYGHEFRENREDPARNWKTWMFRVDGTRWWTAHPYSRPTEPPGLGLPYNSMSGKGNAEPDGLERREPVTPPGVGAVAPRSWQLNAGVWTRHWFEIRLCQPPSAFVEWNRDVLGGKTLSPNPEEPSGCWHMISSWIADEKRDPVALTRKVPWRTGGALLSDFQFEAHTSATPDQTGPIIGYMRNLVMLKDYTIGSSAKTDALILSRPQR